MVDFVAVDFRPLKGGVPDADDIKAAEFTLARLASKAGFLSANVKGPRRFERNGVSWYTIEWHVDGKQQAENASAEEDNGNPQNPLA